MLENVQSPGVEDAGKPADAGRWCSSSRRRLVFVLLVPTVVLFFYNTTMKDLLPAWNPAQWGLTSGGQRHGALPPQPRAPPARPKPTETGPTPPPYRSPGPYVVEYPSEYHFVINEPKTCERRKPFLVLVVPVAPDDKAHRDVIRSTWGGERRALGRAVALFFLMGLRAAPAPTDERLLRESREHGDLIQSDFLDSYKNLTIKTMVMLEWLQAHCRGAAYAMKVDTDMFLNVPKLVGMLASAPRTGYLTGRVQGGAAVHRYRTSKWFLPVEIYPAAHYPRYALGMGYVFSMDLPERLLGASRHVRAVYIEDVYLGMCMSHLGIGPTNPPSWSYFQVEPRRYSRCAYAQLVAMTTHPADDRLWVWEEFKRPGQHC